jgi:hypothetical protein
MMFRIATPRVVFATVSGRYLRFAPARAAAASQWSPQAVSRIAIAATYAITGVYAVYLTVTM